MSDLTNIEKLKLERLFDMGGGYVLGFSNRSLQQFFIELLDIDIYDTRYSGYGDSKANRLRSFWSKESNYKVSSLIIAMLEYWNEINQRLEKEVDLKTEDLYNDCLKIAEKLRSESLSDHIKDLSEPDLDDKDFKLLAKKIKESIEKNEPEIALDRLHTYLVKFIRNLCDKHCITYDINKPLHSFYGEYVKFLRKSGFIDSDMTDRILRSSISILEAFNDVRNNKSFAHDNKILLNYNESMLVFKNISSTIAFIQSVESKVNSSRDEEDNNWEQELPF